MKKSSFLSLASDGFYNIRYQTWGPENGTPLLCVHGLTGSSADFHYVGELLAKYNYRTIAIDIAGRGDSDYFRNHDDYCFKQYINDITCWLAHMGYTKPASIHYLGVSMGGLLGIILAAMPNTPIKSMILSDVGPDVPEADLNLIRDYLSRGPVFETIDDVVNAFKQGKGTCFDRGPMSDEQFVYYATTHVKQREDGKYIRSFDTGIAKQFQTQPLGNNNNLWHCWENITQPVLTLRGEWSTLFPNNIAQEMINRKKGAAMELQIIASCGHVPSLYPDEQIMRLLNWLEQTQAHQA